MGDAPGADPLDGVGGALPFLIGPTAAGKSELALEMAERLDAEIVSVDSMLVYRGMDIGTAKPTAASRKTSLEDQVSWVWVGCMGISRW